MYIAQSPLKVTSRLVYRLSSDRHVKSKNEEGILAKTILDFHFRLSYQPSFFTSEIDDTKLYYAAEIGIFSGTGGRRAAQQEASTEDNQSA